MFELFPTKSFSDELKKLETVQRERIKKKLNATLNEPFLYYERLTGCDLSKLRVGKYRVVCQINISEKKIYLLSVGHRKNAYQKL